MQIKIVKCSDSTKWYSSLIGKEISCMWIDRYNRAIITDNKSTRKQSRLMINSGDFEKLTFGYTRKRETYTEDEKTEIFLLFDNGYIVEDISEKFDLKLAYCYLLREEWNKLKGVHLGAKNEPYYTGEEEAQGEFCARYEDLSEQEKVIYNNL